MTDAIDPSRLVPEGRICGEDDEETAALRKMLSDATSYLESFEWCPPIGSRYLGYGIGGVIGVFLFGFERPVAGRERWLWVVVGDLPSAYFVIDRAKNPAQAMEVYCELMQEWVESVRQKSSLENVFPVKVAPTAEHAAMLDTRIQLLRERIIPLCREECG